MEFDPLLLEPVGKLGSSLEHKAVEKLSLVEFYRVSETLRLERLLEVEHIARNTPAKPPGFDLQFTRKGRVPDRPAEEFAQVAPRFRLERIGPE